MVHLTMIPRNVWLFWDKGLSQAPSIVQKCIQSWVDKNPTWSLIVLDSISIHNYIKLDLPTEVMTNLSSAHQSDLIRLLLLSKYGGVWADATTFCTKSLDEWIDDYSPSGFFVFDRPDRHKLISNWFIASSKNGIIVTKLYQMLTQYWIEHRFKKPSMLKSYITSCLTRLINRNENTTKFWFHPIVTNLLHIYPYSVFHYMFERLISNDPEAKNIWLKMKKLSADIPHFIQKVGLFSFPSQALLKQIDELDSPMFKLTWRYDHHQYKSQTLLYSLIESDDQ